MEACCSFKSLVGGRQCSFDPKDKKRQTQIIPLLSTKDISRHKSTLTFSGPQNEIDLILCRTFLFTEPAHLNSMTICPYHRASLGIGWTRGSSTRCRVPQTISGHDKSKASTWPKGDRGLGKEESWIILHRTGLFVPVGSGAFNDMQLQLLFTG